jgi:hypothetical protein
MRPLRRAGATPDVLWEQDAVLVRRSHTLKDEYMETTRTGLRQRITVSSEVMSVKNRVRVRCACDRFAGDHPSGGTAQAAARARGRLHPLAAR